MTATTVTIPSFTDPTTDYTLTLVGDQIYCSCPSRQKPCKHVRAHLQAKKMLNDYAQNWRGNAAEVSG